MGNEFGHPEWIDFPREGNGWSYHYARRQWSLADNADLLYHDLQEFDRAMVRFIDSVKAFPSLHIEQYHIHEEDKTLAFGRGDYLFVFNFHPTRSHVDYPINVPEGSYSVVIDTDCKAFGGYGLIDDSLIYATQPAEKAGTAACPALAPLRLYLPARTALVIKRNTNN